MKTKLTITIVCMLISFYSNAQVDMSILNKGIKDHIQKKTEQVKDSSTLIQEKIELLKKQKEEETTLKQIQLQYEADKNQTLLAIDAKNNEITIAQQNLQNVKGIVSNKKIEFLALFNSSDPVPSEQIKEIDQNITSLSTIPSSSEEEKIDRNVIVNERYNQQQKDSLSVLTIHYRKLDNILDQTNRKIQEGKSFTEKLNGYIKNRNEFLANADKIQKEYEAEKIKKNQLIQSEDTLISANIKRIDSEVKKYNTNRIKFIAIKDNDLTPEEQSVFDQIEYELFKETPADSSVVSIDSVSSKYFKEQYNQLIKLNTELGEKKKQNQVLNKRLEFIKGVNAFLENSLQSVYGQEVKSLENAVKEQEKLQKKLNDAKNGVFDETAVQKTEKDQKTKEETTTTTAKPERKRRW